jgi:cytochrome c553
MRVEWVDDAPGNTVLADRHEQDPGRHLTAIACEWCHGRNLSGSPEAVARSLPGALGYDLGAFRRFLRTGRARDGGALPRGVGDVHRLRFSQLSEAEIEALFAFAQRVH